MDRYLNTVSPLLHGAGYMVLLAPFLLLLVTWKRESWLQRSVLGGYFFLILFSLGINKLTDGTHDLLFHYSRFYLGMGLVSAHLLARLVSSIRRGNILMGAWFGMSAFLLASTFGLGKQIKAAADQSGQTYAVEKTYIQDMKDKAAWLDNVVAKEQSSLPVILTTDYPLHTESIWLRTQSPSYYVVFHDAPKYPWIYSEASCPEPFDLIMVVEFPTVLDANRLRHADYHRRDEAGEYFVLRSITHWKAAVAAFLNP